MRPTNKQRRQCLALLAVCLFVCPAAAPAQVNLAADFSRTEGEWSMTRFTVGQGGLQSDPMIALNIKEVRELHPRIIRLFVGEYYRMLPARGKYDWTKLDRELHAIRATGARPAMALTMKPPLLFPKVDHDVVHPNDYGEWERLIEALVRHCQEQKFDVALWEIGNEPDIGESGGTPYRFKVDKDYTTYYTRTVAAIRRVDPRAQVGGPAVANARSSLVAALIEHCATQRVPLDFISWHLYSNSPVDHAANIARQREKLARFPELKGVKTYISEWNMDLTKPNLSPGFQPAFVIETIRRFAEDGLDMASYYHIRDCFVDPADFDWMSPKGLDFMAHWWNTMPQYSALFDHHGRVRPAWYAFRLLSRFEGPRVPVEGETGGIRAIAVREASRQHVLVWRFEPADGTEIDVTVKLSHLDGRRVRVVALDAAAPVNNLQVLQLISTKTAEEKPISIRLKPWDIHWIEIE